MCAHPDRAADTLPAMKITGAPTDALLKAASIQRARAAGLASAPDANAVRAAASLDARAARIQDVASITPATRTATPAASVSAPGPDPDPGDAARRLERIVSAVVPGRVDFDDARVSSASSLTVGGAYALYTRPSDKNAAATAVSVGRSLDITG